MHGVAFATFFLCTIRRVGFRFYHRKGMHTSRNKITEKFPSVHGTRRSWKDGWRDRYWSGDKPSPVVKRGLKHMIFQINRPVFSATLDSGVLIDRSPFTVVDIYETALFSRVRVYEDANNLFRWPFSSFSYSTVGTGIHWLGPASAS